MLELTSRLVIFYIAICSFIYSMSYCHFLFQCAFFFLRKIKRKNLNEKKKIDILFFALFSL